MAGFSAAARKASSDKVARIERAIKAVKAGGKATLGDGFDDYRKKNLPQVWHVTDSSGNVVFSEQISDARIRTFEVEGLTADGNKRLSETKETKASKPKA